MGAPRVYTRSGDGGETGLFFGGRISKSDPVAEALGTVDEAISMMGLARSLSGSDRVRGTLMRVQRELYVLMAELATAPGNRGRLAAGAGVVTARMVQELEGLIDGLGEDVTIPAAFIVPGGSPASAAIDSARASTRTAERRVVALREAGRLESDEVLRYVNRASDLLFMLARYEDRDLPNELMAGGEDRAAEPGADP